MFLIFQHEVPLLTLTKLDCRIPSHQTGFLAANFGRLILYNHASPISSHRRISAILPPSCKGPSADVYDGMTLVASYSSRTLCAQLKKCGGQSCSWNGLNSKGAIKGKAIICDGMLYSWRC